MMRNNSEKGKPVITAYGKHVKIDHFAAPLDGDIRGKPY
jgi:hypothetical protein